MQRITGIAGMMLAAVLLTGCPISVSQRGSIAQALDNTSIILADAQQAEIIVYGQGLIPQPDHVLIQQEFVAVAQLGKTTDNCVLTAADLTTSLACLKSELTTIDQINTQGGLGLKSDKAKSTYNTVMLAVRAVVQGVYTTLGGK